MLLLPAIWGWWVSFTFSTKNVEINLIFPRNCTENSLKLLLFMKDGENFSTSSLDSYYGGLVLCVSVGTAGRRGHYHYRNPIISMYYLWHIFKTADIFSFQDAVCSQTRVDFETAFIVKFHLTDSVRPGIFQERGHAPSAWLVERLRGPDRK